MKKRAAKKVAAERIGRGKRGKKRQPPIALKKQNNFKIPSGSKRELKSEVKMTSRDSCQTHLEQKLIKTTKSLEIRAGSSCRHGLNAYIPKCFKVRFRSNI